MAEANRCRKRNDEDKGGGKRRDLPFVTDGRMRMMLSAPHGKGRRLYVAVADVSHYVQEGSLLDQEAALRTSIYFPDRVIPTSRTPFQRTCPELHVDRLVMAVWFDLRKDGGALETGIEEASSTVMLG